MRAVLFFSGRYRRLERRKQDPGGGYRLVDPEHLEDLHVGRVVDPSDRLLHTEVTLGDLERDQVVFVVGGDREHRVGSFDTRLGEEADLAAVAAHDDASELGLEPVGAPGLLLDEGDFVTALDEVAREVVADRAASHHDDVHRALGALHQDTLDVLGAFDGGTDRVDAELLVGLGTLGIVDTGHHVRDLEDVLGDLGGHDVAVVALCDGDETVGLLDAGPAEDVDVGAVADDLVAAEVPGEDSPGRGARKGVRVAIHDDDLVAGAIHVGRDLRADTTTPDDQEPQGWLIIGTPFDSPVDARSEVASISGA